MKGCFSEMELRVIIESDVKNKCHRMLRHSMAIINL
ncbi:MAG: hypothetical protein ACI9V8_001349, partial [Urechidicola sp.]